MNSYKGRSLADTVSAMGSMLLFLIFAVCLLVMIASAASTYARISSGFDRTFSTSASLRYVSNKIREATSCEIIGGGSGLALESGGIVCVIYSADGAMYEKSLPAGSEPTADGGDRIFDIGSMEITENGGLYTITVKADGESSAVMVRGG